MTTLKKYDVQRHLSLMIEYPIIFGVFKYDLLVDMIDSLSEREIRHLSHKAVAMTKEVKDYPFAAILGIVISMTMSVFMGDISSEAAKSLSGLALIVLTFSAGAVLIKAVQRIGNNCRKRIAAACAEVLEKR